MEIIFIIIMFLKLANIQTDKKNKQTTYFYTVFSTEKLRSFRKCKVYKLEWVLVVEEWTFNCFTCQGLYNIFLKITYSTHGLHKNIKCVTFKNYCHDYFMDIIRIPTFFSTFLKFTLPMYSWKVNIKRRWNLFWTPCILNEDGLQNIHKRIIT